MVSRWPYHQSVQWPPTQAPPTPCQGQPTSSFNRRAAKHAWLSFFSSATSRLSRSSSLGLPEAPRCAACTARMVFSVLHPTHLPTHPLYCPTHPLYCPTHPFYCPSHSPHLYSPSHPPTHPCTATYSPTHCLTFWASSSWPVSPRMWPSNSMFLLL